jgi:hypothetical protein
MCRWSGAENAMSRVIMFIAVLTVALVLSDYNGRAATTVGKSVSKTCHTHAPPAKYNPASRSFTIDAEGTDDLSVHFILWSDERTLSVHVSDNPILETRKAATYPLPIFIIQHRLLI